MFEGIAKTNTTHTLIKMNLLICLFEGIAKTNTTHTHPVLYIFFHRLRVLLKQIQHTPKLNSYEYNF